MPDRSPNHGWSTVRVKDVGGPIAVLPWSQTSPARSLSISLAVEPDGVIADPRVNTLLGEMRDLRAALRVTL
jgi:hypothetical protein